MATRLSKVDITLRVMPNRAFHQPKTWQVNRRQIVRASVVGPRDDEQLKRINLAPRADQPPVAGRLDSELWID